MTETTTANPVHDFIQKAVTDHPVVLFMKGVPEQPQCGFWAQDMGTAHWRSLAPADAQATWAWIALRHEVDYRRALMPGETAFARTWVADTAEGPRFTRFIRIDAADGAMCAQVQTAWVLIE